MSCDNATYGDRAGMRDVAVTPAGIVQTRNMDESEGRSVTCKGLEGISEQNPAGSFRTRKDSPRSLREFRGEINEGNVECDEGNIYNS